MLAIITIVCAFFGTAFASSDYDVDITSVCQSYAANGQCIAWKHSGTMKVPRAACFPASAQILGSNNESISMAQLKINDTVVTSCGLQPVRAWLHRSETLETLYITLHTANGSITLSEMHNVWINDKYVFAQSAVPGDMLSGNVTILRITRDNSTGVYAPYTDCGDFYVGNGNGTESFLVHAFAHIDNPIYYNGIFRPLLDATEYMYPDVNTLTNSTIYMHPLSDKLQWLFGDMVVHFPNDPTMLASGSTRSKSSSSSSSSSSSTMDDDTTSKEEEDNANLFILLFNIISLTIYVPVNVTVN